MWAPFEAPTIRRSYLCNRDRLHQAANTQIPDHPFHIVGQNVERHFGADVLESFHQEVRRSHPRLYRAERMLHSMTAQAEGWSLGSYAMCPGSSQSTPNTTLPVELCGIVSFDVDGPLGQRATMAEVDLAGISSAHHVAWARRAVMLVDIVGSVRLIERDEVGVVAHWLDFIDRVKRDVLPLCRGRLVKSLGDGMLLDFQDVRSAVSAALAIQRARNQANADRPADSQIMLRTGIEVSNVIVEADDVHGRGVNLAARDPRIESLLGQVSSTFRWALYDREPLPT